MILLAVLVAEDLLEAHVYQPLIVGRTVRLHPVVVLIALTVGGTLAGIIGALSAIPVAAAVSAAAKYITGMEDMHGNTVPDTGHQVPVAPPSRALHRRPGPELIQTRLRPPGGRSVDGLGESAVRPRGRAGALIASPDCAESPE